MAIFMLQCKYEQTKTWFVDAANEEDARKVYDTANLEIEHEPHMFDQSGRLHSVVKLEGKPSKKIMQCAIVADLHPID